MQGIRCPAQIRAVEATVRIFRVFLPLLAATFLAAAPAVHAQNPTPPVTERSGPLYDQLARMDSILFDAAFVSCDTAVLNGIFTDDAEFYHDINGLSVGPQVRADFARMAASCPAGQGVRRVLVPGSLEVYPMRGYGAVQTGVHRFVRADGQPGGIAKFISLWRNVDGHWRLARVVSFDHHEEPSAR